MRIHKLDRFSPDMTGVESSASPTPTWSARQSSSSCACESALKRNVAINGATVLTAFDIFAAAGGANRAIARTFTTTANANGQVVIQFSRAGGPDNPKVCGITVSSP